MRRYLEIDVGNSYWKWRLLQGGKVLYQGRSATLLLERCERASLVSDAGLCEIENIKIDQVYICSVAKDECSQRLAALIDWLWGCEILWFESQALTAGVSNSYSDPKKMGADRWLATISAVHLLPHKDLYVVDCGSAINVERIDSQARHLGGYIIPGVALMQESLLKKAAKIASASKDSCIELGCDTASNVANGSLYTAVAVVERLQREMQLVDGCVVLTGGDAPKVLEFIENINITHRPELVLEGFEFWRNAHSDSNPGWQ